LAAASPGPEFSGPANREASQSHHSAAHGTAFTPEHRAGITGKGQVVSVVLDCKIVSSVY